MERHMDGLIQTQLFAPCVFDVFDLDITKHITLRSKSDRNEHCCAWQYQTCWNICKLVSLWRLVWMAISNMLISGWACDNNGTSHGGTYSKPLFPHCVFLSFWNRYIYIYIYICIKNTNISINVWHKWKGVWVTSETWYEIQPDLYSQFKFARILMTSLLFGKCLACPKRCNKMFKPLARGPCSSR